jgi:hypothetical protein
MRSILILIVSVANWLKPTIWATISPAIRNDISAAESHETLGPIDDERIVNALIASSVICSLRTAPVRSRPRHDLSRHYRE